MAGPGWRNTIECNLSVCSRLPGSQITAVLSGVFSMKKTRTNALQQLVVYLACLLIFRVTLSVILIYRDYLPPNFDSDFLRGRQRYFFGSYQWAFYVHIATGPCSLVLGMFLMSEQFRLRFRRWHRCLGRIQTAVILLLLTPSGLWMAFYAETGVIAGTGFAALAVATGVCTSLGWRSAVKRQFIEHRRWMWRCFILLCSAVVQRVMGGLGTTAGIEGEWAYQLASWSSWLLPLAVFEVTQLTKYSPSRG